ncbi:hypothetical protein MAR_027729, partial [Mya arenaria]
MRGKCERIFRKNVDPNVIKRSNQEVQIINPNVPEKYQKCYYSNILSWEVEWNTKFSRHVKISAALACLTYILQPIFLELLKELTTQGKMISKDFLTVINDLRKIRPFHHTEQKKVGGLFVKKMSPTEEVDIKKLKE